MNEFQSVLSFKPEIHPIWIAHLSNATKQRFKVGDTITLRWLDESVNQSWKIVDRQSGRLLVQEIEVEK